MKKLLLSLATLLCGAGAWGQRVTDLPELTTDLDNPVYYVMHNTRSTSGGLIYFDAADNGSIKDNNPSVLTDAYKFYFTDAGNGKVKICNKATDLKLAGPKQWTADGADCVIAVTPHSSQAGLSIRFGYNNGTNSDYLNEQNYDGGYTEWRADDEGSIFMLEKVEDVHMPVAGQTYIIESPLFVNTSGNMKGMTIATDAEAATWNTVKYNNANDQWVCNMNDEGNKISLKNVATGQYLNGTALSATEVFGDIRYWGCGQFNVIINSVTYHAGDHNSGSGANGSLITWNGGLNSASAWKFVKANANEFAIAFYDKSPVKITTDDSDKKYFAIKSGRGDAYWYTLTDDNKIHLNEFTGADNQLWYLKATMNEAGDKAYVQLFPKNGDGKAMSYRNTSDGANKIVGQALDTEGWTNMWKLIYVDGIGHCRMQTSDETNYLSNHTGTTENMGLYNGSIDTDTGTQMYIYDTNGAFRELNNLISEATQRTSNTIYGYYKPSDVFTAAMTEANGRTLLNTVSEVLNSWLGLKTAVSGLEQILPTPGFYRIKNYGEDGTGNAYLIAGTEGRVKFKNGEDTQISSVFYYDGTKLVSYANGLYFGNNNTNFMNYSSSVGAEYNIQFESDYRMDGKCFVKFPGGAGNTTNCERYLNCGSVTTEGGEVQTDAGGSVTISTTDMRYRYNIEPVQWLPVMKPASNNGYATIFSPVALALKSNLEAYVAESTENGRVQMTSVDVVPANTGVILKSYEGVETDADNGYVYLQIVSNTDAPESKLKGTLADEYITPEADTKCYVLATPTDKETAFYKAALNQQGNSAFVNNGFKAYLPVANGTVPARFLFDFGTETGIEDINGAETETNAVIYDLSGRRVQNAQKGIYIINGKKVIK